MVMIGNSDEHHHRQRVARDQPELVGEDHAEPTAARSRRRLPPGSAAYRRPVTVRYTDSRLGRTISIDRSEPRVGAERGEQLRGARRGIGGRDAHGRAVDDRAVDARGGRDRRRRT